MHFLGHYKILALIKKNIKFLMLLIEFNYGVPDDNKMRSLVT
jgi:hypothetical protein